MITTDKSVLHHLMMRDFTQLYASLENCRAEFVGGPSSHIKSRLWNASQVSSWFLKGFGRCRFARCKSDGSFASVELNRPYHFSEIELSRNFSDHGEVKGCAFQGANAIIDWVKGGLGLKTLLKYSNPQNLELISLEDKLCTLSDHKAKRGRNVYFLSMEKVR